MLKASLGALKLLKFVLSFTGEKELDAKGMEVNSPRKMNADDASQRRHFMKALEAIEKPIEDRIKKETEEFNQKLDDAKAKWREENPMAEDENKGVYENRLLSEVEKNKELVDEVSRINNAILDDTKMVHELALSEKTLDVVKKYFAEFGEKVGFLPGDDESVDELLEVLK